MKQNKEVGLFYLFAALKKEVNQNDNETKRQKKREVSKADLVEDWVLETLNKKKK